MGDKAKTKNSVSLMMIVGVPLVEPSFTIKEAKNKIKERIKDLEAIDYLYVVDKNKKLLGALSIKDLFRYPDNEKIENVYKKTPPIFVYPQTSQEAAAHLALRHKLKAVPVVDENRRLVGILSTENVLSIINKEAREDILHLAGVHQRHLVIDDVLKISLFEAVKHRIVWLFLGLFGGLLAASIVERYEIILRQNLILAAFIPLVVYMADAVGTQMEAFAIRDFAIHSRLNYFQYFLKQFKIVFLIGLIISAGLIIVGPIFYRDFKIMLIISFALFVAILSSLLTGLFVPYLFAKLKQDPADASGPIATIIQDILSVLIYFFIASSLL